LELAKVWKGWRRTQKFGRGFSRSISNERWSEKLWMGCEVGILFWLQAWLVLASSTSFELKSLLVCLNSSCSHY
jgi:hypothetical protein